MPETKLSPEYETNQAQAFFAKLENKLTDDQRFYLEEYVSSIIGRESETDLDQQLYWEDEFEVISKYVHNFGISKPLLEFHKMLSICKTPEEKVEYFLEAKDINDFTDWTAREIFMFAAACGAQDVR